MTTLTRRDDLAAVPGAHLWLVSAGRLLGAVAGSGSSWDSGLVGPLRSRPWIRTQRHATRSAAVARLAGGEA